QYEHGMFEYGIHHLSQSIGSKLAKPARTATEKVRKVKPYQPTAGVGGIALRFETVLAVR
ncbi:MAG: hypothetical protein ABI600_07705, partial [Luteolibacter sp.]